MVARDGAEALEYLFGRGAYADRDRRDLPAVMLLDLRLPKVDGLEVLRQVRESDVTQLLAVVILTSSKEDQDLLSRLQQLRPQAGQLWAIPRHRAALGALLAACQSAPSPARLSAS